MSDKENKENKENINSSENNEEAKAVAELLFHKNKPKAVVQEEKIDKQAMDEIDEAIDKLIPQSDNPDMNWYVIHTYSGYEGRVKDILMERVKALKKEKEFGSVLIPSERIVELIKGKRKIGERKLFPGYVFLQMVMSEENWYLVRNTARVSGFIGKGKKPVPISPEEIRNLAKQIVEGTVRPKPKINFSSGDVVKVKEGPFSNFHGVVDEINLEKSKVKVMVSIFGRTTPVELDFSQVEKI